MAYHSPKEIGGILWEGFNRARNSICHFLYVAPEIFRWLSQQRFRSKASRNMPHVVERYQELYVLLPACVRPSFQRVRNKHAQNIAIAFGGDATPPGTFNGILVKKEYRPSLAQVSASFSTSHSSPMRVLHRASRH